MGDAAAGSSSVITITSTISSTTLYYANSLDQTTATSTLHVPTPNGPRLTTETIVLSASPTSTQSSNTASVAISNPFTGVGGISTSSRSTSASDHSTSSAPPASTTKPASGQTSPNPSPGLGGGPVAGIAVGCLVGGALIAVLLTWLFMSNRQKKHRSSGGGFAGERHRSSRVSNEKALPVAPIAAGGVAGNWEKHLDQPESDGTITRRVKGLFDHIEVHVENFYRDALVKITPELQAALMRVDSRDLPDSVVGLLPQTERPTMLIKHCIAHSIVEHISSESDVQDSFLPVDFVALPQALATRRTTASKPAYNQAYSRWRVLSSYLRPKPAEDSSYTTTRDTHITAWADAICHAFDPWAMSRDNFTSRRDNMINIMKSASDTGVLLFSQPSTLKWCWSIPESKSGRVRIVLLPGLEKTRDENANELQRPLELLRPVTGVIIG